MIGKRIRQLRIEKGVNIDELAEKLGKNRATVYRYEKGDIENLPLDILEPLAKALDTTPAYIMGWDKNMHWTKIKENEKTTFYFGANETNIKHFKRWHDEFGLEPFTDEEHEKIIEYTKFLLHLREKK